MASRNHPDHPPDDELLESARRILTTKDTTFVLTPWRTTMAKAQAVEKSKAMKAALKNIAPAPKHVPRGSESDRAIVEEFKDALNGGPEALLALDAKIRGEGKGGTSFAKVDTGQPDTVDAQPSEDEIMQAIHAGRRATDPIIGHVGHVEAQRTVHTRKGDSIEQNPVVESGFSIFNQRAGAPQMTDTTKAVNSNFPEKRASPEQAAKEAAVKKAIADKAEKKAAAEAKSTETKAAREAAALARAAKIAENAAARAAKAEELKAAGRTYVGTMTQLAERVKAGAYVKSLTGQLRSTDELAVALDAVPAANVVILGIKALKLDSNPYAALNIGQQSMNLRNRMRGAIKKGTLTLDAIKAIRDQDGLATAEAEVAKKAEAKAARLKAAAEAQTAKLAAEAKALEAKQLKEAEAAKATTTAPAKKTAKPAAVQTGATA